MIKFGIVVISYKNSDRLERLLVALDQARYSRSDIMFIISIDSSEFHEVERIAESYEWKHGQKVVRVSDRHMGLRQHILKCGDYLNEYNLDAAVILEDDVFPSVNYFEYVESASEKFISDDNIAGVALYRHNSPRFSQQLFEPIAESNGFFLLQYACSWGQIWFRNQWNDFRKWYDAFDDNEEAWSQLPYNVRLWDDNSWLKYHILYCVLKNKYFVYPDRSYSTCFSEEGVHTNASSDICQVPLIHNTSTEGSRVNIPDKIKPIYDVFFENVNLSTFIWGRNLIQDNQDDITIDLYGAKEQINTRYLLTCKALDYPILCSWGNRLIPHELNVIRDIEGDDIMLYDLGSNSVKLFDHIKPSQNRHQVMFMILHKMLIDMERGGSRSVRLPSSVNNVAVYGYGVMGKHLKKYLEFNNIFVNYVIDKLTEDLSQNCYRLDSLGQVSLPIVDCIIVSPFYDYQQIKNELSMIDALKTVDCISITDLFTE